MHGWQAKANMAMLASHDMSVNKKLDFLSHQV
jgi:hypothetical protein